jgi:hypothetical protein
MVMWYRFDNDIPKAIAYFESLIRKDPLNVNEIVILNLYVLYEFYYPDHKERKAVIDVKTPRHHGANVL